MQTNLSSVMNSCQNAITSLANSFDSRTPFVFFFFFLAGIIVLKTYLTLQKARLQAESLKQDSLKTLPKTVGHIALKHSLQQDQIMVIASPKPFAITINLLKPNIALSTSLIKLLTPRELEAVVLHEQYHLQKKHGLFLILGEIFASTLFLLPILRDFQRYLQTLFEIQADAAAAKYQKTTMPLKMALSKLLLPEGDFLYPSFSSSSYEYLEKRVQSLSQPTVRLPKFKIHFEKIIISLFSIGVGFALPSFSRQVVQAQVLQGYESMPQCGLVECVTSCLSEEIMSRRKNTSNQSTTNEALTIHESQPFSSKN